MNNDDLDKLIKRSLNNVAENITLSDPDRLLGSVKIYAQNCLQAPAE